MTDISEADLKRMLSVLKEKEESKVELDSDISDFTKLKNKVTAFLQDQQKFKRGDAVRWKKGLKNKKYPKENQLCIVIDELAEPIIQDNRDSGSPYYREPLDLILAMLDDDTDLVIYHYDKRRFELVS